MDRLLAAQTEAMGKLEGRYLRYLHEKIDWRLRRFVGIQGKKGVGKTTFLLQELRRHERGTALYIKGDDPVFEENSLSTFVTVWHHLDEGRVLLLDDVNMIPNWEEELLYIHAKHREIKVTFTLPSFVDVFNNGMDKIAEMYILPGMSFREYIDMRTGCYRDALWLDEFPGGHVNFCQSLPKDLGILTLFENYLIDEYQGDHCLLEKVSDPGEPYAFIALGSTFRKELQEMSVKHALDPKTAEDIFKLICQYSLYDDLRGRSERCLGLDEEELCKYLAALQSHRLVNNIFSPKKRDAPFGIPVRVFVENTNLLNRVSPNTAREIKLATFIVGQMVNKIGYHPVIVGQNTVVADERYTWLPLPDKSGAGNPKDWKGKSLRPVDGIEIGEGNQVPVWLYGFLY